MIKIRSSYNPDWTINRINYIHKFYPAEFFSGKTILEIGCNFADIGAYFHSIGAKVTSVEGRKDNAKIAKKLYPEQTIVVADLDTLDWQWGKFDVIINFGLFYHLEKHHREHLINCIDNSDLLFFETVVVDDEQPLLVFRDEQGDDQSLTDRAGVPTTSFVENIFLEKAVTFEKHTSIELNSHATAHSIKQEASAEFDKTVNTSDKTFHIYDWIDTNSKVLDIYKRRFWFVKNNVKIN